MTENGTSLTRSEIETFVNAVVLASAAHPAAPQDEFRRVCRAIGAKDILDAAIDRYREGGAEALLKQAEPA